MHESGGRFYGSEGKLVRNVTKSVKHALANRSKLLEQSEKEVTKKQHSRVQDVLNEGV